jgi:hypothetical protein
MTKKQIIAEAKKAAKESNLPIAVVYAPIEEAESKCKYGYCPLLAVSILYRWGKIVQVINP